MPSLFENLSQLYKVVNLAIDNSSDTAVGGIKRLGSAGHINDRKPAVAESNGGNLADLDMESLAIWSTPHQRSSHGLDCMSMRIVCNRARGEYSSDSAHTRR